MTTDDKSILDSTTPTRIILPEKKHGFYNSLTINKSILDTFETCQEAASIERALTNLPHGIENFLDLSLLNAQKIDEEHYELRWQNMPDAKVVGTLTFLLNKASAGRGTLLTAVAKFDGLHPKDDEPSTLMNIFMKRLKALIETGEIPTTKGQPSGREVIEVQEKILH